MERKLQGESDWPMIKIERPIKPSRTVAFSLASWSTVFEKTTYVVLRNSISVALDKDQSGEPNLNVELLIILLVVFSTYCFGSFFLPPYQWRCVIVCSE
jgi:hypothetical protein